MVDRGNMHEKKDLIFWNLRLLRAGNSFLTTEEIRNEGIEGGAVGRLVSTPVIVIILVFLLFYPVLNGSGFCALILILSKGL